MATSSKSRAGREAKLAEYRELVRIARERGDVSEKIIGRVEDSLAAWDAIQAARREILRADGPEDLGREVGAWLQRAYDIGYNHGASGQRRQTSYGVKAAQRKAHERSKPRDVAILRAYRLDANISRVASKLGCDRKTVRAALLRAPREATPRPRPASSAPRSHKALSTLRTKKDFSREQIAAMEKEYRRAQ